MIIGERCVCRRFSRFWQPTLDDYRSFGIDRLFNNDRLFCDDRSFDEDILFNNMLFNDDLFFSNNWPFNNRLFNSDRPFRINRFFNSGGLFNPGRRVGDSRLLGDGRAEHSKRVFRRREPRVSRHCGLEALNGRGVRLGRLAGQRHVVIRNGSCDKRIRQTERRKS